MHTYVRTYVHVYVHNTCKYSFSVIKVAGEKQVDVVSAFVSSLGSQLYTTTSDHSSYDFETIIIILQVHILHFMFCSANSLYGETFGVML